MANYLALYSFQEKSESQSKVRVRKTKNSIWPPGGHFEKDVAENRWASTHMHMYSGTEVWS